VGVGVKRYSFIHLKIGISLGRWRMNKGIKLFLLLLWLSILLLYASFLSFLELVRLMCVM